MIKTIKYIFLLVMLVFSFHTSVAEDMLSFQESAVFLSLQRLSRLGAARKKAGTDGGENPVVPARKDGYRRYCLTKLYFSLNHLVSRFYKSSYLSPA